MPISDDVILDDLKSAKLVFAASDKTVDCTETDTVLNVAKSNGIVIPSGCTFGVCGTCKVKKKSGQVHMIHNGGISDEDIEDGYILACCSNPVGTVEVDI